MIKVLSFFKDNLGAGEGATILACSLPFDYVKTQIQKMQPDAEGKYPYTGSLDCALKTLKFGGPFKLYIGFPVYFVRIAPHFMMKRIFLNQIQKLEKKDGL
ncbi:putative mitochondrial carrier domain superfamily [Helianthus annuus]|nr:putative mitochondrial carrier domain superfamily [Helianthus annuus]